MNHYELEAENFLSHYGIPGMKWGKRKDPATARYRGAKKIYKQAKKNFRKNSGHGFGIKGIEKYTKAETKLNKAEMDFVSEKARYKSSKSSKAEARTWARELNKTGLPGSAMDRSSGGRSTRVYDRMKIEKGKKYADQVMKNVERQQIVGLAGVAVVGVGALVAQTIINNQ